MKGRSGLGKLTIVAATGAGKNPAKVLSDSEGQGNCSELLFASVETTDQSYVEHLVSEAKSFYGFELKYCTNRVAATLN